MIWAIIAIAGWFLSSKIKFLWIIIPSFEVPFPIDWTIRIGMRLDQTSGMHLFAGALLAALPVSIWFPIGAALGMEISDMTGKQGGDIADFILTVLGAFIVKQII